MQATTYRKGIFRKKRTIEGRGTWRMDEEMETFGNVEYWGSWGQGQGLVCLSFSPRAWHHVWHLIYTWMSIKWMNKIVRLLFLWRGKVRHFFSVRMRMKREGKEWRRVKESCRWMKMSEWNWNGLVPGDGAADDLSMLHYNASLSTDRTSGSPRTVSLSSSVLEKSDYHRSVQKHRQYYVPDNGFAHYNDNFPFNSHNSPGNLVIASSCRYKQIKVQIN